MDAMGLLLNPRTIAVVGASPRGGPGRTVLANLRAGGFDGEAFAINPGYEEVLGYRCYPAIAALPHPVDCVVVAVAAEAACAVLDEAYARGTRAAVVLSAGFGEGGHGEARAQRLRALAAGGMAICGPNCFGVLAVKHRVAAYSGVIPATLRPGPVALVSQSGSLVNNAYTPLMEGRELGFSYVVSCGNQTGTPVAAYFDHFVDDPDVTVMAAIIEGLTDPRRLAAVARRAHQHGKTVIVLHNGRSAAGRVMVQSHTGALVGDAQIVSAFLRRAGIIEVASYEELTEAIELFAIAPRDDAIGREVIIISGSGGAAAARGRRAGCRRDAPRRASGGDAGGRAGRAAGIRQRHQSDRRHRGDVHLAHAVAQAARCGAGRAGTAAHRGQCHHAAGRECADAPLRRHLCGGVARIGADRGGVSGERAGRPARSRNRAHAARGARADAARRFDGNAGAEAFADAARLSRPRARRGYRRGSPCP